MVSNDWEKVLGVSKQKAPKDAAQLKLDHLSMRLISQKRNKKAILIVAAFIQVKRLLKNT